MCATDEYLVLEVVAEVLERRLATVEEWTMTGQLPTVRLPNGEILVPRVAIGPRRPVSESDE